MPASSSNGASGVPVHAAVPTASPSQGCETGRGHSRARPLPAHSIVTGTETRSRDCRSASDSDSGRATCPPTSSRHAPASTSGMS